LRSQCDPRLSDAPSSSTSAPSSDGQPVYVRTKLTTRGVTTIARSLPRLLTIVLWSARNISTLDTPRMCSSSCTASSISCGMFAVFATTDGSKFMRPTTARRFWSRTHAPLHMLTKFGFGTAVTYKTKSAFGTPLATWLAGMGVSPQVDADGTSRLPWMRSTDTICWIRAIAAGSTVCVIVLRISCESTWKLAQVTFSPGVRYDGT
jgi:hypothetical protein